MRKYFVIFITLCVVPMLLRAQEDELLYFERYTCEDLGAIVSTDTYKGDQDSLIFQGEKIVWTKDRLLQLGCMHDGLLYAVSSYPADLIMYDSNNGKSKRLGMNFGERGYAITRIDKGILFSVSGGKIYFYDPAMQAEEGKNPRLICSLSESEGQDALLQFITASDGNIYIPSKPAQAQVSGAIIRLNPDDFTITVFRNVIPNQSIISLTFMPETGEIFGTTSIECGEGFEPIASEACVFAWDIKTHKITHAFSPVRDAKAYTNVSRADNGTVYFRWGKTYYAFEPETRYILRRSEFKSGFHLMDTTSKGSKKLIYGVGDDKIFAMDPADNNIYIIFDRHASLIHAQSMFISDKLDLYYSVGAHLWRCKLKKD